MEFKKLKTDKELQQLLPSLSDDEYKGLEKSIVENGFDKTKPIIVWNGYIADGHNRYEICQKHKIGYCSISLDRNMSKQDVIKWMLETQLNRRNLTPVQRIAIAKKYESGFREKAKENSLKGNSLGGKGGQSKSLPKWAETSNSIDTRNEIAKIANVSHSTLSRYDVVQKSDQQDLKDKMNSGKISINRAYDTVRERRNQNKPTSQAHMDENNANEGNLSNDNKVQNKSDLELKELMARERQKIIEAGNGLLVKDDGSETAQVCIKAKADKTDIIRETANQTTLDSVNDYVDKCQRIYDDFCEDINFLQEMFKYNIFTKKTPKEYNETIIALFNTSNEHIQKMAMNLTTKTNEIINRIKENDK